MPVRDLAVSSYLSVGSNLTAVLMPDVLPRGVVGKSASNETWRARPPMPTKFTKEWSSRSVMSADFFIFKGFFFTLTSTVFFYSMAYLTDSIAMPLFLFMSVSKSSKAGTSYFLLI